MKTLWKRCAREKQSQRRRESRRKRQSPRRIQRKYAKPVTAGSEGETALALEDSAERQVVAGVAAAEAKSERLRARIATEQATSMKHACGTSRRFGNSRKFHAKELTNFGRFRRFLRRDRTFSRACPRSAGGFFSASGENTTCTNAVILAAARVIHTCLCCQAASTSQSWGNDRGGS